MFGYIEGDILAIDGINLTVRVTGTGLGFDILVSPSVLGSISRKPENSQKQEVPRSSVSCEADTDEIVCKARGSKIFSKGVSGSGNDGEINFSDDEIRSFSEFSTIKLWIHHHITDVSELLFGFGTQEERSLFRNLNKVNGIGGKTALALLGLGEETLILAIQMEDDKLLSSVPGIGKKTAQKIIVDLKGSIDFSKKSATPVTKIQNQSDILLISSLVSMGYDKTRVESIVGEIDKAGTIESRTIEAIRQLAK